MVKTNQEIMHEYVKNRQANSKAVNTIKTDITSLKGLLSFVDNKPFKNITEEDTRDFIGGFSNVATKVQYATRIIKFYRWFNRLDNRERPSIMKWFEYPSKDLLIKNKDADVKQYLITDEEYQTIIQFCGEEPKWSALFETLYLSGARPNEVNQMNIGDVEIDEKNRVIITLRDSKTIPRKVPLPDNPSMLIRWLEYHPRKIDKNTPLFLSNSHRKYFKRMVTVAINRKFDTIKKYTNIKKTLTPHCFRKTRATIMFSNRDPIFDDTEIGKFFGWKPHTVVDRRQQYDLRDFDDLKEKIQGKNKVRLDTFDIVKQERDTLERKYRNEIRDLKKGISDLKHQLVKKTEIDNFVMDSLSLIAREMIQKQGIESIKEIFRKHNVPLAED